MTKFSSLAKGSFEENRLGAIQVSVTQREPQSPDRFYIHGDWVASTNKYSGFSLTARVSKDYGTLVHTNPPLPAIFWSKPELFADWKPMPDELNGVDLRSPDNVIKVMWDLYTKMRGMVSFG